MSLTIEQIADEALALPKEARALLANRLVESLEAPADEQIEGLWAAEARRRFEEIQTGTADLIPAEEVFQEFDLKFS